MLFLPDFMLTCTDLLKSGAGTHQNHPLCLCQTFTVSSCGSCDPAPIKGLSHLPISSETASFFPSVCPLSDCIQALQVSVELYCQTPIEDRPVTSS